jgi:hypothetical protein
VSVVGGIHLALDWFIQSNINSLTLNDGMLRAKKKKNHHKNTWLLFLVAMSMS